MNGKEGITMNMGKAIRENRLRRNMTQERLASRLNVTAQAVSRWESGQGCPDIALLPELSAVLGVTIDELFACSREQHLERIEAMVEREAMLPREDFDYAMAQAQEGTHSREYRGRCLTLLSDLCMHRSQGYADMAADYARQALEEEPEKKANHSLLGEAIARQTPPRYTDNEESIAQICMIRGDREGAAQAYEHVVQILRGDWGITEGETLEGYLMNIKELRKKN